MDLKLVYYNNEILNKKAESINFDDEQNLNELCEEMIRKMKIYDGIAIAGNQLGILKKIIAIAPIEPFKKSLCIINPEIISYSEKKVSYEEGCLSFPGLYLRIFRPLSIVVKYQTISGKEYIIEAEGLLARVLQHEIDHLNGITFIKRISEAKLKSIEKILESIDNKYNNKRIDK